MTEPAQKPGRSPKHCDVCSQPVDRVPRAGKQRRFCDKCQVVFNRAKWREQDAQRGWKRPGADPQRTKARRDRWYAANRDRARADMLTRYYANADQRRAKSRAWKLQNAERNAAGYAQWAKANRSYLNAIGQRRRLKLMNATAEAVTPTEWLDILDWFGGKCAYCLLPANEIDHLVPVASGGDHSNGNVVPACKRCNASKGKKSLLEWTMWRRSA